MQQALTRLNSQLMDITEVCNDNSSKILIRVLGSFIELSGGKTIEADTVCTVGLYTATRYSHSVPMHGLE